MQNARVVMLNDNKLSAFPQELSALKLMQKLRIESNSITGVPTYINTFALLEELRASDNSISSLSGNIGRCVCLRILDLQRNQLANLPANIGALVGLEKLLLTNNRIRELPFTMSHLGALKTLRVDKNQVTSFGFDVGHLTNLTQLRIGHNQITYVPSNIGKATALLELSVESNQIESLPPSICDLKLDLLRVEANPLKRPPIEVSVRGAETVFRFLRRTQYAVETWKMDLSRFRLKFVPFPDVKTAAPWELMTWCNIQHLSLGHNRLVSLPVEINLMSNLTVLDVNSNKLATVPPSVGTLPRLQVLDAACNAVQALPGNMRSNVQLQELLLENNRITAIPASVADLESLVEMRMPSNRLTKIPEHIGGATALTILSLEHNAIRTISHGSPPARARTPCGGGAGAPAHAARRGGAGITSLASLTHLDLSHNSISEAGPAPIRRAGGARSGAERAGRGAQISASLVKIRPNEDPPRQHEHEVEAAGRLQLGAVVNPEVRRNRVRLVLSGGKRPRWRTIGNVALDELRYERPEGAEGRRGWDLVRFALFGEDGPRLVEKQREEEEAPEAEQVGAAPPRRCGRGRR
jgi:Leucine-rich repeat (LRR) protein